MSSRIADIIVEAKLETAQFARTLKGLRVQIENTFRGIRGIEQPFTNLRRQVTGTGRAISSVTEEARVVASRLQEQADRTTAGIRGTGEEARAVHDEISDSMDRTETAMKDTEREAARFQTQMRWVARDVMRIGFTAGIVGAIFIRTFRDIVRTSFDLLAIFEDIRYLLEDIGWVIGEQIAPIIEILVPPIEMIRDFFEAHKAIAKLVGIVIILGGAFFSLVSIILMTVGMYSILIFGMALFSDEVKRIREGAKRAGTPFQVLTSFIREMGKEFLGIAPAAQQANAAIEQTSQAAQRATISYQQLENIFTMTTEGAPLLTQSLRSQIDTLDSLQRSGRITQEMYDSFRATLMDTAGKVDRASYSWGLLKERIKGITLRGTLAKVGGAGKKVGTGLKSGAMAGMKFAGAMASMVIMMTAIGPMMEALEPIISVISGTFTEVFDAFQPYIDIIADFISQHKTFAMALIVAAAALGAVSAASLPLTSVIIIVAGAVYLLMRFVEWLANALAGHSLTDALKAVWKVLQILFPPLWIVMKLFEHGGDIINALRRGLERFINLIRGVGAFIQNIFPEPLIELGKAILKHLPNPLEILRGILDILGGLWDILTGNWEEGKNKIIGGIKAVLKEFVKIPFLVINIGIEIMKKLWEGIKAFAEWLKSKIKNETVKGIIDWFLELPGKLLEIGKQLLQWFWKGILAFIGWLKQKIFGGSLISDIIGWFTSIPGKLFEIGKDLLNYFWSGIKNIWDSIAKGDIKGLVLAVIGFFGGIPIKLLQYGKDMIIHFIDGFIGMWEKLFGTDGLGGVIAEVGKFFKKLVSDAFDWGIGLIQSFIDGLLSMGQRLGNAISGLFDTNVSAIMEMKSPPQKGPLRDLNRWGEGFVSEFFVGIHRGFNAMNLMGELGTLAPPVGVAGAGVGSQITIQNEFVIHATIRDQQDIYTLRDEISMKQLEQARRMRVLTGGT